MFSNSFDETFDATERTYKLRSQVQGRSVQEYSEARPKPTHSQNHSRDHCSRDAG